MSLYRNNSKICISIFEVQLHQSTKAISDLLNPRSFSTRGSYNVSTAAAARWPLSRVSIAIIHNRAQTHTAQPRVKIRYNITSVLLVPGGQGVQLGERTSRRLPCIYSIYPTPININSHIYIRGRGGDKGSSFFYSLIYLINFSPRSPAPATCVYRGEIRYGQSFSGEI